MSESGRIGWRYLAASAAQYRRSSVVQGARRLLDGPVATVELAELVLGGAQLTRTLPPREVRLTPPPGLSARDARAFLQRDVAAVPEQFVLEVSGATVLGREGWVLHRGRLVEGIWQEAGLSARNLVPRGRALGAERLPGVTGSLLMPWLPNYYHWTVQAVPRLLAVRDVLGARFHDVDRWLVPGGAPRYVQEWLDLLGVPAQRRFEVWGRRQRLDVETLVVASVPGRNRWVAPQDVAGVRRAVAGWAVPAPAGRGSRRVLVRRAVASRRVLLNADELTAAMVSRGFEVVDTADLPLAQEVALFADASIVVGVHGAGLTNLVFAAPGTHVVEVAPRGLVFSTFAKLADAAGAVHHLVPGVEPGLPAPWRFPDTAADVVADVRRVAEVVDAVDASAGRRAVSLSSDRHRGPVPELCTGCD